MGSGAVAGARHRVAERVTKAQLRAERRSLAAQPRRAQGMTAGRPGEGAGPIADGGRQPPPSEAGERRAQPRQASRAGDLAAKAKIAAKVSVEALEQPGLGEYGRNGVTVASADLSNDEARLSHLPSPLRPPSPGRAMPPLTTSRPWWAPKTDGHVMR